MKPFLEAIDERVLVCDGAMGTMLYAKGVFINRCFDALNLTEPARVVKCIRIRALAQMSSRRTPSGPTGSSCEGSAWPIGCATSTSKALALPGKWRADARMSRARLARWGSNRAVGKDRKDEAEAFFREQAEALLAGGVDLFVLETFRDLDEIRAAIAAIRSIVICRSWHR